MKPEIIISGSEIENPAAVISADVPDCVSEKGDAFACEIEEKRVCDFEKPGDRMVHVSTFAVAGGTIYMTYYANTDTEAEDPNFQRARLVYCPADRPEEKTYLDVQAVGDVFDGRRVNMVYDTILARSGGDELTVMWTAKLDDMYYRLYRPFSISGKTLGDIGISRFGCGGVWDDFSTGGIKNVLSENGVGIKTMYSDIGIMQKFTSRIENGERRFYTGAYSGDFNCLIRSRDFRSWEYVSQPDFQNMSKWENAVYLLGDKCFYFVRQHDETGYGFLTSYDLEKKTWDRPVLVEDCQSRGDFIYYKGGLYLFHAPIDREHIGIIKVDTDDLSASRPILQAKMKSSCFYPFVQYFDDEGLAMSYTVARKHIRLARFTMDRYI